MWRPLLHLVAPGTFIFYLLILAGWPRPLAHDWLSFYFSASSINWTSPHPTAGKIAKITTSNKYYIVSISSKYIGKTLKEAKYRWIHVESHPASNSL